MNFDYYIPTRILFGAGRLNDLENLNLPWKKALIVITNGNSMKKYGYLDRVISCLKKNNVESVVYDKVVPNPMTIQVMEATEIVKKEGCDFVIGLGGGSAIDTAKAIAIMALNDGDIWEYVKGKTPDKGGLPIIAIPSTAGTGTEADPWSVITNPETQEKIGFGYDETYPFLSIIDPEIMKSVPSKLTAFQGIDALCHSIEGYLAKVCQPVSEIYALDSIMLISRFLILAVQNGDDLLAREHMAWASTLAGMVESSSMCISQHGIEHAMSAYYPNLTHGAGLSALLIPYLTKILEKADDGIKLKFSNMAMAMGVNLFDVPEQDKPYQLIKTISSLIEKIGLSDLKLSECGLKKSDAERIAVNARQSMGFLFDVDPVKLTKEDVMEIVEKAIQ